jgi:hypothetical protein
VLEQNRSQRRSTPGTTVTAVADAPADLRRPRRRARTSAEPQPDQPAAAAAPARPSRSAWTAAGAVALALGVVLRFWATSDLWLDEALSVSIAEVPLTDLPDALRQDGAPPLYYVLLHGWMKIWGSGDLAVRSLSGLMATATLPLIWLAGRRVGTRATAWAAALLLASSPFAVRYATETRMYALVLLLTLAGHLVLTRAFERPSPGRLAAVAAVSAALLYTHYWSLFLLAVVGTWLLIRSRREVAARWCLAAVALGGIAWLPWLPIFLFQARHTGTPWVLPAAAGLIPETIGSFAGSRTDAGSFLEVLYVALLVLGLFARAVDGWRTELTTRVRPAARPLAAVVGATLVLGWAVGVLSDSAFTPRYTTVVLGSFLLLLALGVGNIASPRARRVALATAVTLGLLASAVNIGALRTQGSLVASAVSRQGSPGDVIAYCPDHLGPAAHRLLPDGFQQVTFPSGDSPERIDWVDYRERAQATSARRFARDLVERAGEGSSIFLVWSPGRVEVGARCDELLEALGDLRDPEPVFPMRARYQEKMALTRFDP